MRIERLSAFDLTNLAVEAADTPMHVGVIAMVDGCGLLDAAGRPRLAAIHARLRAGVCGAPRLRQVVYRPGLLAGRPIWVDDPGFRVERHVAAVAVEAPGGEAELLRLTERLLAAPLDRARPLWYLWIVTGLPDHRVAVVVQLHHAVGDGAAAVRLLGALLDPPSAAEAPWAPAPPPPWRQLVVERLRGIRRARPGTGRSRGPGSGTARTALGAEPAKDAAGPAMGADGLAMGRAEPTLRGAGPAKGGAEPARGRAGPTMGRAGSTLGGAWQTLRRAWAAPRTSLNGPIGVGRRLGVVRLDLAEAKTVAHAAGGKANDVLLTVVAGGLRELLLARGEPVSGLELRVAVTVALHAADGPASGRDGSAGGPEEPAGGADGPAGGRDEPASGKAELAGGPAELAGGRDGAAGGNHNGSVVVRLPVGDADPRARLRAVAAETARAKRGQAAVAQQGFMVAVARTGLARRLSRSQHLVNLVVSNVPGPPAPVRVLGAPAIELVPVGALAGNLAISFLALSYAGRLVVTAIADRARFPDLPVVLAGMERDWAALTGAHH
ncbi:wax ester/triacylglycerol synthase domain-containing protein [Dactylosporangium sp. NPDC005572]|uniref:wax ester/triacylglycerol synthase domain-containing protein n=1 Tax=Dactylosporangium sp. NPDC005572 TaxID=3156889 RepID=UPI0033AF6E4F